jgi:hypothetical protein
MSASCLRAWCHLHVVGTALTTSRGVFRGTLVHSRASSQGKAKGAHHTHYRAEHGTARLAGLGKVHMVIFYKAMPIIICG